jgi:hypothetical protein
VQKNQVGLKLNWTLQLLAYADDVNLLGDNLAATKRNRGRLFDVTKEVGSDLNAERTKCVLLSCHQNHDIKIVSDHLKMCHSSDI